MSLRLACLEIWTPATVRRRLLDELATTTATAFGCPAPHWTSRSYQDRLGEFARFTDTQARRVLSDAARTPAEAGIGEAELPAETDAAAAKTRVPADAVGRGSPVFADTGGPSARCSAAATRCATALRAAAEVLGVDLRRRLGVHTQAQAARALRLLYHHIGIEMLVAANGEVRVRRCLFSDYYSPEVCELMGSVDDGIAAGIVGSGLSFPERLTDGSPVCRGRLGVPA